MQQARQYLLADESGKEFEFHIATNNGESSSIFEFGLHKQMRPDISMSHTMTLQSSTFDDFVKREKIDLSEYQALLLDTQGSELLVLHGARQSLFAFQFIQVEAADFEAYTGGCTLVDISKFMQSAGWKEVRREPISKPRSLGRYYELLYSPA